MIQNIVNEVELQMKAVPEAALSQKLTKFVELFASTQVGASSD